MLTIHGFFERVPFLISLLLRKKKKDEVYASKCLSKIW